MEVGNADQIFHTPKHPYTHGLITCVPNIKLDQEMLTTMEGNPPDLVSPPAGCRFSPRCPKVMEVCRKNAPGFTDFGEGHKAACWLHEQGGAG